MRSYLKNLLAKAKREIKYLLIPLVLFLSFFSWLRITDLEEKLKESLSEKHLIKSDFLSYKALQTNDMTLRMRIAAAAVSESASGVDSRKILFETLAAQQLFYTYRAEREKKHDFCPSSGQLFVLGKNSYILDKEGFLIGNPTIPVHTKDILLLNSGEKYVITVDGYLSKSELPHAEIVLQEKKYRFKKFYRSKNGKTFALQGEKMALILDESLKVLDKIETANKFPEIIHDESGEKWAVLTGVNKWKIGGRKIKKHIEIRAEKIYFHTQKNTWLRIYYGKLYLDSLEKNNTKKHIAPEMLVRNVREAFFFKDKIVFQGHNGFWKILNLDGKNQSINLPSQYKFLAVENHFLAFVSYNHQISLFDSVFFKQAEIDFEQDIVEPPKFSSDGKCLFVAEKRYFSLIKLNLLNTVSPNLLLKITSNRCLYFQEKTLFDMDGKEVFTQIFYENIDSIKAINTNMAIIFADKSTFFYDLKHKKVIALNPTFKLLSCLDDGFLYQKDKLFGFANYEQSYFFERKGEQIFRFEKNKKILIIQPNDVEIFDEEGTFLAKINLEKLSIYAGENGFCLTQNHKTFDWYDANAALLFQINTEAMCTPILAADNSKILFKKITSKTEKQTYFGLESMYNSEGKRILLEREPLRPKLIAIHFDKTSKYLITTNAARTEYWDIDAFRIYSTEGELVFVDENRHLIIAKQKEQIVFYNLLGQSITKFLKPNLIKIDYNDKIGLLTLIYPHHFEYINLDIPTILDWIEVNLHKLNLEEKKKWIEQ